MKHVLTTKQFQRKAEIEKLFKLAEKFQKEDKKGKIQTDLKGKLIATLFYEPSTRTRFSFETAMLKLGGQVITTENAKDFSSAVKGETIEDTARVVGNYVDGVVMRHTETNAAEKAAAVSPVTIINAGDGSGEHPTQALLDLYTIKKEIGRMDNLKIGMVGDLKYGRTIHSLIYLLSIFKNIEIFLISPDELKAPEGCVEFMKKRNMPFTESNDLEKFLPKVDVLYMTRVQQERFSSTRLYNKVKDSFVIDERSLKLLPKKSIIMHPLPRVNEISMEVDADPRAAYFRQAGNGLYVRMAILKTFIK